MKVKRQLVSVFALITVVFFIWLVMEDKSTRTYLYPDFGVDLPGNYQLLGIDVSHYQGEIDWNLVSNMKTGQDSVAFVFIKLTEGTALEDKMAQANAGGAQDESIPFGFYHFFRPSLSAADQALFFAENAQNYDYSLRPVIDIELTENCNAEKIVDSVYTFMEIVEKKTKHRPVIYTNESFFNDIFKSSYLKNEFFWIANYNGTCEAMELNTVLIWQFSDRGTVNGISEKVDLNIAKPEFWDQFMLDEKSE